MALSESEISKAMYPKEKKIFLKPIIAQRHSVSFGKQMKKIFTLIYKRSKKEHQKILVFLYLSLDQDLTLSLI